MTDQLAHQPHTHQRRGNEGRTRDVLDYADIELHPMQLPLDLELPDHVHDDGSPLLRKARDLVLTNDLSILAVIASLTARTTSSWAVLVVTFEDDPAPSSDLSRYQAVFTSSGAGTMNMVDYFADVSHGKLDLSRSRVFGPYVLARPRSDYVGNVYPQPTGKLNRNGVLDLARATATAGGVDLSTFAGVVVCGTPTLDLCGWVGGGAALCGDDNLRPSLLGQEMSHGYGLDHSRASGSSADYQDPWDTMSTANAWMATHPTYGAVGPGLNATNMRLQGWLDASRTHAVDTTRAATETVTLRPLHARHLPGTLALVVGDYTVELRTRARWDAGIPRACVLVHRPDGNRSILQKGTGGNADLVAGDHFEVGLRGGLFGEHVRVQVDSIDESNEKATVTVAYEPTYVPHVPQTAGTVFGGIPVDGPGFVVVNGRVIKVPPRGPARDLLESVVDYLAADQQPTSKLAALETVTDRLGAAARDLELVSHTPPGIERITDG